MQGDVDIAALLARLDEVQATVKAIHEMLKQKSIAEHSIGDFIPEWAAIELSGLKKSTLYAMRKAGKLTSSTISGKGVFYKKSDFQRILNEQEKY